MPKTASGTSKKPVSITAAMKRLRAYGSIKQLFKSTNFTRDYEVADPIAVEYRHKPVHYQVIVGGRKYGIAKIEEPASSRPVHLEFVERTRDGVRILGYRQFDR